MLEDPTLDADRRDAILSFLREELQRELDDPDRRREWAHSGRGFDTRIGAERAHNLLTRTFELIFEGHRPRNKRELAGLLGTRDRQVAALLDLPTGPTLETAGPLERVIARVISRTVAEFAPGPPEALVVSSPNALASAPIGPRWPRCFGMNAEGAGGTGSQRVFAVYLCASQTGYGYSVPPMAAVAATADDGLTEAQEFGREQAITDPARYLAQLVEHTTEQVDLALGRQLSVVVLQGRKDDLTSTSGSTLANERSSVLADPRWPDAMARIAAARPLLIEVADPADPGAERLDPNFEFRPHDAPGSIISADEFMRQVRNPAGGDALTGCFRWVALGLYDEEHACQAVTYEGALVDRRTGAKSRPVVIGDFHRSIVFAVPYGPDGKDPYPNLGQEGGHPPAELATAAARRIHLDDVAGGDFVGTCRRNIGRAQNYLKIAGRPPNVRENAMAIGSLARLGHLNFPTFDPEGERALI